LVNYEIGGIARAVKFKPGAELRQEERIQHVDDPFGHCWATE
jgi:hypothetical protein